MPGLENLLGGDLAKSLGGLVEQFESGNAHQVSSQDAVAHHDAVAKHLSAEDYEQAAIEAASKLTPEQRQELAAKLTHAAKAKGKRVPAAAAPKDDGTPSAEVVGKLMGALEGQGGLTNVAGELLGDPTVKSALVGIAGSAAKSFL